MTAWRIAGRPLEFPPPLAAGIVNVTDDSFYEGARSETPERAVEDGLALAEAGFDLLDVGAVPARSGPAVSVDEEAARLVPPGGGLARRARGAGGPGNLPGEGAGPAPPPRASAVQHHPGGPGPQNP